MGQIPLSGCLAAALHAEFCSDWLGRGFSVLQLPGSCWLFSMPDALRDGVSWGGREGGGEGLWEQEGGRYVEGRGEGGGFSIKSSG